MNPQTSFEDGDQTDYARPVAYDAEGFPLYRHPARETVAPEAEAEPEPTPAPPAQPTTHPGVVRTVESPQDEATRQSVAKRHEFSRQKFPNLELGDNEYVVRNAVRHPIGIISIWISTIASMAVVAILWLILILQTPQTGDLLASGDAKFNFTLVILGLETLLLFFGWVGDNVYRGNRFIVTNERVIQYVRLSLVTRRRKTIGLASIEDVSYWRNGLLQMIFNYGSIRLSTIGDETTYRFTIVAHPAEQTRAINEVVQSIKNNRLIPDEVLEELYGVDRRAI